MFKCLINQIANSVTTMAKPGLLYQALNAEKETRFKKVTAPKVTGDKYDEMFL